jgi:phenylalanyl-tRNA synthetase beta chain
VGILRTSERLALRTEGSNRWEKGVDPHVAGQAASLATELIVDLAGARWTGNTDVVGELPPRPVVRFRPERANALTGIEVPDDEQRALLERLGFDVSAAWDVTVPTWRTRDVTREADVVEEVARVHLAEVPFNLPLRREMHGRLSKEQRLRRLVEDVLVGCGLEEVYTSSLAPEDDDPNALRLPVPLTADQRVLRTSLWRGLVEAARVNVDAGNERIDLFEVTRVYLPAGGALPEERWRAGGIVEGGFARAKGVVETLLAALGLEGRFRRGSRHFLHPGKTAVLDEGWVGELHPSLLPGAWGLFELDLADLAEHVPERVVHEDVVTFPAVRQDLAFVVAEETPAGDLVDAAREAAGPLLRQARVFDVYRGGQIPEGKKSVAVAVAFQSPERTLSDDDARVLRERVVAALAERFGAELRA